MRTLRVRASREYDVHIGAGLLKEVSALTRGMYGRALTVTDENVAGLYADELGAQELCVLAPGEHNKTPQALMRIYGALARGGYTRADAIIALGGGVVTDVAGLAAATYMRGITLIMCPTTLIAQADAALGGKCAVNLEYGKNLMGTVYQPHMVIADTAALATLPKREHAQGMAELLKCGCIADAALFDAVAQLGAGEAQIFDACSIKRRYVEQDEADTGARHALNFGHTLGHAIERASGFSLLHGEAVGIGMAYAARLGSALGITQRGAADAIERALNALGLPVRCPYDRAELAAQLKYEKKRANETINAVLLKSIGESVLVPLSAEEFLSAL